MIFTGMIYNPLSVYTAPILAEFPEFTRAQYAMTMTIMSIVCAVANMFLGKLKQLINTRGIVTLGGVLMTVGLFIYSKSTSLGMFYVAAIVVGIAFAFLATAICGTIINTWFAKHTGMLVGATVSLAGLGGTIFSPIVGGWIAQYGWRHSFNIVTIVSLVCTVIIALCFRSTPETVGVKPLFFEEGSGEEKKTESVFGITFKRGHEERQLLVCHCYLARHRHHRLLHHGHHLYLCSGSRLLSGGGRRGACAYVHREHDHAVHYRLGV